MEEEGRLWFRARRDPQARARLQKGYVVELYVSAASIVIGTGLVFIPDAGWIAECILLITFGICGTAFGWIQLSRIKKMDAESGDRE